MLTMAGRLEEAGKSQQLSGSRDVVAELCLALGMFIKLSLGVLAGSWWSTLQEPLFLPADVLPSRKNKGEVGLCIRFDFSPCSLAASFGKEMFCSQEVHCESILHPRHKLLAVLIELIKGTW